MGGYKNFKEYMEDKYYNELYDCVKGYVCQNKDSFEDDEILRVKWVDLEDICVSGVTFKEAGNGELEIRVTVDAAVDVEGKARYGYDHFDVSRCCCVFFLAFLEDGLQNVRLIKVEEYSPNQYDRDRSLSQNLVPYMYEEDVEKHAEDFLARHCKKALLQPMPLPVNEIAVEMGMQILYAPLENGVFGKTYFGCEEVKVYDDIAHKNLLTITTKPGTMLINPDVYFMYNLGTANNTIIHECVHWDRHRRPFELQKLLTEDCNHITCELIETYDGIEPDSPALKWMEWQASQLAPRILMPAEMTKKELTTRLHRLRAENPMARNAELMEQAIHELALFFGVSMLAAKLRAIELGFDEALGTSVYVDGRHLPPFSFKRGSLKLDESYLISENNAIIEIFTSDELRSLYYDGKIIYANGMVCINAPKYVTENEHGVS